MSKGFVDAVVAGDLNTAGDEFLQAVQAKRDADWENAKLNLAHQVFGDAEAPEAFEESPPPLQRTKKMDATRPKTCPKS